MVWRYVDAHGDADGHAATPLPGLGLMRAYAPTPMAKTIYRPLVCLILQGAKQVMMGADVYDFATGTVAIVSADVPVASQITAASRAAPYLAVAVDLDMALLSELSAQTNAATAAATTAPPTALFLDETDEAIADCALRLVRLLERPEAIAILHAPLMRELHYWLLAGRRGASIARLVRPDAIGRRLARAIAILREEFDRPLRVERLAAAAGMSASTFHQHFRAVTLLSPLQFQKQLRLVEARRRMRCDGVPASRAAFEVGYESVSQFSREYRRLFGLPPARDISLNRAA